MADTSERIIILSALLLVVIIVQSTAIMTSRTIVTLGDIEVEIVTSSDNYTLGEGFTASVYFVNNRSEDVWMKPIYQYYVVGGNVNDPNPIVEEVHVTYASGTTLIQYPANSKTKFANGYFMPQYSGEFRISCFGASKTVLVLDSPRFNASVRLDDYSYVNEKPILTITNYGQNIIP